MDTEQTPFAHLPISSFAKPVPIRGVHLQQADRRATYRGAADDKDSVALEMFIPPVLPPGRGGGVGSGG
jgi:hypothetical protein